MKNSTANRFTLCMVSAAFASAAVAPTHAGDCMEWRNFCDCNDPPQALNAAMAFYQGELVASRIGGAGGFGLGRWDGVSWQAHPASLDGVNTLIVYNGDLIAAGSFWWAGGGSANRIARWDGSQWHPLGSGLNDTVLALATYNGDLIAAGTFTTAGGQSANRIARWDGSQWHALGSGLDDTVLAVISHDAGLIAAGAFATAGGQEVNAVARWDGAAWQPMGSGVKIEGFFGSSTGNALAVYEGDLYLGGMFNRAGKAVVNNMVRWDGTAWQDVGGGLQEPPFPVSVVRALAVHGGALVAGGDFTSAAGQPAMHIARWNGSSWQPLEAGGFNASVRALLEHEGVLYARGSFTQAGGTSARHFAQLTECIIIGACCINGTPIDITEDQCNAVGGVFFANAAAGSVECDPPCPADISGDGIVDVLDLLELLDAWGECPQ
jgi:hypothetical protein